MAKGDLVRPSGAKGHRDPVFAAHQPASQRLPPDVVLGAFLRQKKYEREDAHIPAREEGIESAIDGVPSMKPGRIEFHRIRSNLHKRA